MKVLKSQRVFLEAARIEFTRKDFFNSTVDVLQILVITWVTGLGIWEDSNLIEKYGNDNPGAMLVVDEGVNNFLYQK